MTTTINADDWLKKTQEIKKELKDRDIVKFDDEVDGYRMFELASQRYFDLLKEKDRIIKIILAQLFKKGVIVEEELSVRRNEFFRFRQRSELTLPNIKKTILEHIHSAIKNLSMKDDDTTKDLLEYVLDCIDENDYDKGYWGSLIEIHSIKDKTITLNKTYEVIVCDEQKYSGNQLEYQIRKFKSISVKPNGSIEFDCSLPSQLHSAFITKFEDKIMEKVNEFAKEFDTKIKAKTKEIEELKDKGSKQLCLASLTTKPEENGI